MAAIRRDEEMPYVRDIVGTIVLSLLFLADAFFLALNFAWLFQSLTSQNHNTVLVTALSISTLFLALVVLGVALQRQPSGVSRRLAIGIVLYIILGYLGIEALVQSPVDFRPALLFALLSACLLVIVTVGKHTSIGRALSPLQSIEDDQIILV